VFLAGTSVWIDHLRSAVPALAALLELALVLHHPMRRGEVACGSLRHRPRGAATASVLYLRLRRLLGGATAGPRAGSVSPFRFRPSRSGNADRWTTRPSSVSSPPMTSPETTL
jgi:hypothetical protein